MKSVIIAFAMYSKIPMPHVEWDKRSLSWALCAFPLVGVVIGAVLYGWLYLADFLGFTAMKAAGAVLLPLALSGCIHMDGFCDTCDALSSHQSRERKLEILKDSHTGAFAIICCGLYLLVSYALWREVNTAGESALILALGPVLSRSYSGLAGVSWKNARGSGLLATFTEPVDGKWAQVILCLMVLFTAGAMLLINPVLGGAAVLGAAVTFLYYRVMAYRQFGGITGDTEGFFLQLCECVMVLAMLIGQKVWGV